MLVISIRQDWKTIQSHFVIIAIANNSGCTNSNGRITHFIVTKTQIRLVSIT